MHELIGVACRRTAGIAAGLILTGGLAGGVLLTPSTAYAAGPTPAITGTTQTPGFNGTTLNVQVSVTPAPAPPAGAVSVSGAGGGCSARLSGTSGTSSCNISGLAPGTYRLTATYDGSSSSPYSVTVGSGSAPAPTPTSGSAPVFNADSPPTSVDGQSYSYMFHANGSPAPSYALAGAPGWLNINPSTGMVSGTIPDGTTSFSYSVVALNSWGSVTAGPWTVYFRHNYYVNIRTYLSCSSRVFTGQRGICTLWVSNSGKNFASGVTAQIALPWPLRADSTTSEYLGTLFPGETRHLTVVFTAETGFGIWGRHPGHPFTVRVVGSASSYGSYLNFFFLGQRQSYSVAYVTIVPRGFWW